MKRDWSGMADLKAQVKRIWDRGEILGGLAMGLPAVPKRLVLKGPTSRELATRFDDVRAWIAELRGLSHIRIVYREFRHPQLGGNRVPAEAWVDSAEEIAAWLGKGREVKLFATLVARTRERMPKILPWVADHPHAAIELVEDWDRLLDVTDWLRNNPRPGCYLREVDVPNVHTKFIETHRGVLGELFDLALPPHSIDPHATGISNFCRRYGFREKTPRIRFRLLDRGLAPTHPISETDFEITLSAFSRLDLPVERVIITENEINFLALPDMGRTLAVWGAGYALDTLRDARWLDRCDLRYWGDIDTHGFAILDLLRSLFPHARSILMDRDTLLAHRSQWVTEPKPVKRELARLDPAERLLFEDLRDDRLGQSVRLEQERLRFGAVKAAFLEVDTESAPARDPALPRVSG